MLGFSPLSSSSLGSAGAASVPVVFAPVTGVQALGQTGVLGLTTVQNPTQEITGVEATVEVTDQPIARQHAFVSVTGFDITAEKNIAPVTLIIGSYFSVYAIPDCTAELGDLPLTGLTRVIEVTSAGELTAEVSAVGVAKVASVGGVETTSEIRSVLAFVDMNQGITGFDVSAEIGTLSVVVHAFVDISGVDATLEVTRMPHVPVIFEMQGGFEKSLQLEELSNEPVVTIISAGLEKTVQLESLDNTPVIQSLSGVDGTIEVENLDNTPVIQSLSGVEGTIQLENLDNTSVIQLLSGVDGTIEVENLDNTPVIQSLSGVEGTIQLENLDNTSVIQLLSGVDGTIEVENLDNKPGNATRVGSLELIAQTEAVAIAHGCGIELADLECQASAGNVIVSIAQRRTIIGVQAAQELNDLEAIFIAFPISIDISGVQAVTALGTVQLIEVVRVPFAKSLPAGLSNFVFLSPANANFAIVDNKINRLG